MKIDLSNMQERIVMIQQKENQLNAMASI